MDYGHPLVFGVHLKASAASNSETSQTAELLELAQKADTLKFRYLSLDSEARDEGQGSEENPENGLDHWTLASYIAGATGSIALRAHAPQESNPVLVGRSAASLDMLSGGRADLSLGAHDLSELGSRLSEEITIIRGMWDTTSGEGLSFVGDHYYVPGTQRGPAPAHSIAIWIKGMEPEHLETAGAVADGWVAELGSPDIIFPVHLRELGKLSSGVDAAATQAGRDPREIRRQIVVKPENLPGISNRDTTDSVGSLLALAEAGFAEILFETTDQSLLVWLANTLRPEVFAELARKRATEGISVGVLKSAAIRARRVGSLDYDSIPESLKNVAVEPGDPTFANYRNTYLRGGNPSIVINARTVEHVQDTVRWASTQNVPFSIRSGGHGFSGKSTNNGGIVLNLRELREIELLDESAGLVRIGPGAQWAEAAAALEPYGLAISSGDSGAVGVGGLATVGGIGFFSKQHGLTIDYIQAIEVVTADGELVRASATENPELFWGMRGAGPNFGVAVSFEFKAQPSQVLAHVQLAFQVDDLGAYFERWGELVENTPNDTTLFLMAGAGRAGQPNIVQLYGVVNSEDQQVILDRLQPFATLAPLVGQQVYLTTYAGAIGEPVHGPQRGQGEPVGRSGALQHIDREAGQALADLVNSGVVGFFQIRTAGGAASAVPEDATAFSGRHDLFHILAMGSNRARLNTAWHRLEQHFDGFYLNFETDTSPVRVKSAFSAEKWERLVNLKREYDPNNLFKDNFNIAP